MKNPPTESNSCVLLVSWNDDWIVMTMILVIVMTLFFWWLWWHCFSGGCDDNYSGDCDIRKTLGGSWEKVGKQIPLLNYKTKALLTFPFYVDLVLLIFICKHHLQITIMRIFQLHCIEGIQGWIETESNQAIAGFMHLPNFKFQIPLNRVESDFL